MAKTCPKRKQLKQILITVVKKEKQKLFSQWTLANREQMVWSLENAGRRFQQKITGEKLIDIIHEEIERWDENT